MFLQEIIQKISSFTSLLSPIEWFTWFTYFVILPTCSLFGWLALPFVVIAFIIANIFGAIQLLLRAIYPSENDTENINGMFVSTREALRIILPQASNEDIGKYDEQLNKVDEFDPVLIISPNHNWITQNTLRNYQTVMNAFATNNLRPNSRRDENSLCVFHFSTVTELYTVRGNIRRLHPNAFFDRNAQPQQEPIGTAWILNKVGVRTSDFALSERLEHHKKSNPPYASLLLVNEEVRKQIPNITDTTLWKKVERSRKLYTLFINIGEDKIQRVKSFSALTISKLRQEDIDNIIL
ncbi:14358_t:CDS:2 [Gigaspora margarita]|uniref:14358_t:CDS:1 n=1 Tax=Gigaspora margarita TaxID=4874 RepID=A0ABN7U7N0_GIGMA|nr:14358_t:CDS:2 [Gigaspora margarita]